MSKSCIHEVALAYVGGGSDKVYVVQVTEESLGGTLEYRTTGYYGRRGASLAAQEKYKGPSKSLALNEAAKLEVAKRRHRSTPYSTMALPGGTRPPGMPAGTPVPGAPAMPSSTPTPAPAARAVVGAVAMLATDLPEDQVLALLDDPNYAVQKKYDGERATVSLRRSVSQAANRDGLARSISDTVQAELTKLLAKPEFRDDQETVIDCEVMGDEIVIYDLITLQGIDMRKMPFVERYFTLEALLTGHEGLLAPTYWNSAEKHAVLAQAIAENWEGLIFRNLDGEYLSGRSKDLIRYKLWATATCRVLSINTKRSIQLGLRDAGNDEVFIGNVTVPANMDIPELDGLVEVRYLYCHEGGSLYQPVLLRSRNDVAECDIIAALRRPPPEKVAA